MYYENHTEYEFNDTDQGSFDTYVVWDAEARFIIPEGHRSVHAAPLFCGRASIWSPQAIYGVKANNRVGIVGVGGLDHLGVQFAAKMGCQVVMFSGTESRREEAMAFWAREFHVTKGVSDLKHVKKLNHLRITISQQPEYSMYISSILYVTCEGLTHMTLRYILRMAAEGSIYPITVSFDKSPISMLSLLRRAFMSRDLLT